jgi:multidrug efflux pump
LNSVIEALIDRARTVVVLLLIIVAGGLLAYQEMPKEGEPDVEFPLATVKLRLEGVSPEDAERLLVRPMEQALWSIDGLKEIRAAASEGMATLVVEFHPEIEIDKALQDVRERVNSARAKLPSGAEEPQIDQVRYSDFDPMLVVTLTGEVPERALHRAARDLKKRIETVAGVLDVGLVGVRKALLEVVIDPVAMESYSLWPSDILDLVGRNNSLVAAGSMRGDRGQFAIKVPGLIESADDMLSLPVKASDGRVVLFRDIATVRRAYEDVASFARLDGQRAIGIEVTQRTGANVLATTDDVKQLVARATKQLPDGVTVTYTRDKSRDVKTNVASLVNNISTAVIVVFVLLIAMLGLQNSLLVGVAIPGSFCAAFLLLNLSGFSTNMMVLFGLIMSVGMLIDGAIVVVEYADRQMCEGVPARDAYRIGAQRMAWPIIASTATTLAAFLPLIFWPGLIGSFMVFLPMTLIYVLSASLVMALIFVPVVGTIAGRPSQSRQHMSSHRGTGNNGGLNEVGGLTAVYTRLLRSALRKPLATVAAMISVLLVIFFAYMNLGKGFTMWPDIDPDRGSVEIRAVGDLSTFEKDQITRLVESRIRGIEGIHRVYARSGQPAQGAAADQIGLISLTFHEWQFRRPAKEIAVEIRDRVSDIAGVIIDVRLPGAGPETGKPIRIEATGLSLKALRHAVTRIREEIEHYPGVRNVDDTAPAPGIEWRLVVDRAEAAKFGADVTLVGNIVQLVTHGIRLGSYRPDDTDEEIDIRIRFPKDRRSLDQLTALRIPTAGGSVPMSTFVSEEPVEATQAITRSNMRRSMLVQADIEEGYPIDPIVTRLKASLPDLGIPEDVEIQFNGGAASQNETRRFLINAGFTAIALIAIILITQFNSIFQAVSILTAVLCSTGGVLLGLLISGNAFSLINCGIGTIALAGIVVNNNIVLIDTFNQFRRIGTPPLEAMTRTCAERFRPVLLTTITTVCGLLPMALAWNIDLLNQEFSVGGPGTQWWQEMSTAIVGGLVFSTILTLFLTPSLIILQARLASSLRTLMSPRHSNEIERDQASATLVR